MTAQRPETASFSEFATLAGIRKSYVTQLKHEGRLVLTDDGRAVRVAESLERIKATRDPARIDAVERHAAARGSELPQAHGPPTAEEDNESEAPRSGAYHEARARKEHWLAKAAERDYQVSIGKLLDADQVVAVAADAATNLRVAFEALPEILGPQLAAEQDEARCRALIAEAIEHALEEAARRFSRIAKAST